MQGGRDDIGQQQGLGGKEGSLQGLHHRRELNNEFKAAKVIIGKNIQLNAFNVKRPWSFLTLRETGSAQIGRAHV